MGPFCWQRLRLCGRGTDWAERDSIQSLIQAAFSQMQISHPFSCRCCYRNAVYQPGLIFENSDLTDFFSSNALILIVHNRKIYYIKWLLTSKAKRKGLRRWCRRQRGLTAERRAGARTGHKQVSINSDIKTQMLKFKKTRQNSAGGARLKIATWIGVNKNLFTRLEYVT